MYSLSPTIHGVRLQKNRDRVLLLNFHKCIQMHDRLLQLAHAIFQLRSQHKPFRRVIHTYETGERDGKSIQVQIWMVQYLNYREFIWNTALTIKKCHKMHTSQSVWDHRLSHQRYHFSQYCWNLLYTVGSTAWAHNRPHRELQHTCHGQVSFFISFCSLNSLLLLKINQEKNTKRKGLLWLVRSIWLNW